MESKNSSAVIIGCGRLGGYLAGALSESGYSVVVIDRDADRFGELPASFSGFTVEGNADEFATLQRAKVGSAQIFAAVTDSDSVNLMTAQIARRLYRVPSVASRVYDRELEDFCRKQEIVPILSVTVEAESFFAILQAGSVRR